MKEILNDRDIYSYAQFEVIENLLGRNFTKSSEIFWYSFPFLNGFVSKQDKRSILAHLLGREKEWGPRYGITLAGLEECCRIESADSDISLKPWLEVARQIAVPN